jgi:penicillin-binding protein 1A
VSVEPATGAVRAMLGGPGFEHYQFNVATKVPGRSPGSSFKTFVLLALLEHGYVPDDSVSGSSPCRFPNPGGTPDPYEAENFEGSRGGTATIVQQTLRSSNCAYLRLGQIVGLQNVVEMTERLGVSSPIEPVLSMPIGAEEVLPLDMAAAYAAIANDGIYNPPYMIERVEDRDGNVIFQHEPDGRRAMSVQTARLATRVLEQNVLSGTGTRARLPGRQAAGKTGTAQNSADAWFVGFTPQLATAVWMGQPDGQIPMRGVGGITVTGGSFPARIWGAYMTMAHEGLDVIEFHDAGSTRRGTYLRLPDEKETRPRTSSSSSRSSATTRAPTPAPTTVTVAPTVPPTTLPTPTTKPPKDTPPPGDGTGDTGGSG